MSCTKVEGTMVFIKVIKYTVPPLDSVTVVNFLNLYTCVQYDATLNSQLKN